MKQGKIISLKSTKGVNMGSEKSSGTTVVNQTTKATPTAEETALNKLELERAQKAQPGQIQTQESGLNLINQLLTGNSDLPGFFKQLSGGISEDMTSQMVQSSLKDLYPQFQSSGIMDSGTAAAVAGRTAGDIRMGTAEYNQQNLMQLLNLALSGSTSIQQPLLAQSASLGSRLAGLRSTNTSGTTNTTSSSMNPFLKSFQTSFGSSMGALPADFLSYKGGF
jgi:hypothetical protein